MKILKLTFLSILLISSVSLFAKDSRTCKLKNPTTVESLNTSDTVKAEINKHIKNKKKLDAIRVIRSNCDDFTLKESKNFVESLLKK